MIGIGISIFNRKATGEPVDPDAQAFIDAAGITDPDQQDAVYYLFGALKDADLYNSLYAFWPMVGGSADSHKFNAKDPQDTDEAFRLLFAGGWTHSSTGAKPNAVNGWANTFFIPQDHLPDDQNSNHSSIYLRTNANGTFLDMVALNTALDSQQQIYGRIGGNARATNHDAVANIVATADSLGYYINSRVDASGFKLYKNGTSILSVSVAPVASIENSFTLSAGNVPGVGVIQFSPREVAFASTGVGLDAIQATNLRTIVQQYQTLLGRQV